MLLKNIKTLFICKKRNATYGISIGLVNSAQFIANFLISQKIPSKVVSVIDSNFIDKEVHLYKPTHVVIHALWVPPYKMKELAAKYPKIIWLIRIHSKVPFIAHEGMAMEWITEYYKIQKRHKNINITANSKDFKEAIESSLKEKVEYLPNLYMPSYPAPPIDPLWSNSIAIGCFGAIRPLKNHLLQAMAAMTFGDKINKKVYFNVNCDRMEQNGQNVLKNLRALFNSSNKHVLVENKWKNHKDFLKLVAKMDMGMQFSLSETYNIVAADFVYVGIPMVVSPEIRWMPWYSKADPYDISNMVKILERNYCLGNMFGGKFCRWLNRKYLDRDNQDAGKIWLNYLSKQFISFVI